MSAAADPAGHGRVPRGRRLWHAVASLLVLALGSAASISVSVSEAGHLKVYEAQRFESAVAGLRDDTFLHLARHQDLATGLQGLYAASNEVSAEEFARFVAVPLADRGLSGLTGVAVLERAGDEIVVRHRGAAAGDPTGFALPADGASLMQTLEATAVSRTPRLTPPLEISPGRPEAVMLVAPLDTPDGQTTAWAAVSLNPKRLLGQIVGSEGVGIGLELFDGTPASERLVTSRPRDFTFDVDDPRRAVVAVPVAGRLWTLRMQPLHVTRSTSGEHSQHEVLLVAGLLLSLLLAAFTWSLGRSKNHALRIVAATTADLRASEQRFRSLAAASPLGVFRLTAAASCEYVNRRLADLAGREEAELLGDGLLRAIHPDDRGVLRDAWSGEASETALRLRLLRPDGTSSWVKTHAAPLLDKDQMVTGWVGSVEDVTAEVEAQEASQRLSEALAHQARHDHLTNLPNRAYFADLYGGDILAAGPEAMATVLFFDVDRFKVVNDSLGHDAGDRLLVVIADRLRQALRPDDLAARFGGDEFVVGLRGLHSEAEAREEAARIMELLTEPVDLEGRSLDVTVSMGVAVTAEPVSPDVLITRADTAMYMAKSRGKARVECFTERRDRPAGSVLELEHELRTAVAQGQVTLAYQPIVAIDTGAVIGAEALARWNHPDRGPISPAEFIPLAEESGLIVGLGEQVLRTGCRQLRAWHDALPLIRRPSLTVNVSARQLDDPGFTATVVDALGESGVDPASLVLELTESALLRDLEAADEALRDVRALGVRIAVDDFGTGYSSLSHLKRLPVDMLKIDQTFVGDLGNDLEDTAIVGAVVRLARAMGMVSVAEGVEARSQLDWLATLGCDLAQGYWLARPTDAATVATAMSRGLDHFTGCAPNYSGIAAL